MKFVSADPRTGGLASDVGTTVLYVSGGSATLLVKHSASNTDWVPAPAGGSAEPVSADPRSAGLARPVGARVMYVTGGAATILYKHSHGDTDWCTWVPPGTSTGSGYFPGGWP